MRLNGRLGVCYGSQDPQMSDNEDRKPSEGEVVQNSRVDTLYTHAFNEGTASEGRFFNIVTLDDGSQRLEMELTPRIRITFIFIKERNVISSVTIQKHRINKRWGWRPDKKEEVRLTPITFGKVTAPRLMLSMESLRYRKWSATSSRSTLKRRRWSMTKGIHWGSTFLISRQKATC